MTQTHRNRQTDKEWAGGRLRLLLVKRQGWEFTLGTPTRREPCQWLREEYLGDGFIKFADMPCGGCDCVVEGGCAQGCCVGGRERAG